MKLWSYTDSCKWILLLKPPKWNLQMYNTICNYDHIIYWVLGQILPLPRAFVFYHSRMRTVPYSIHSPLLPNQEWILKFGKNILQNANIDTVNQRLSTWWLTLSPGALGLKGVGVGLNSDTEPRIEIIYIYIPMCATFTAVQFIKKHEIM